MTVCMRMIALCALVAVAACAAPERRWIKAGVDAKTYEGDRRFCLETVDRDFNPYYDYGMPGNRSGSQEALFRQDAAEQMFQDCMRKRGYRLVTIEPPNQR